MVSLSGCESFTVRVPEPYLSECPILPFPDGTNKDLEYQWGYYLSCTIKANDDKKAIKELNND